ncbi:MAG TPA: hypothetical protein VHV29_06825 [Terriglobales bacterium]|jgi:hypothetical protein|nr:hypothetical protein [Terriglobales bacterium]
MKSGLDEYTRNARLRPAFLVALPVALAVAGLGFKESATEGTLFGLASSLGFTFLLSQLVRDTGKSKEKLLFDKWGGKPTTVMLQHRDTRLNAHTLARYHLRLCSLLPDIKLPTAAQEKEHATEADEKYASCVDYLLSKTRDKERFQLLFQENMNYGFRRNLWALKPIGITLCIFSLAALAVLTRVQARANAVVWFGNITAISIVSLLLVWWFIRITPNWVRIAADGYAERLLASIDEL